MNFISSPIIILLYHNYLDPIWFSPSVPLCLYLIEWISLFFPLIYSSFQPFSYYKVLHIHQVISSSLPHLLNLFELYSFALKHQTYHTILLKFHQFHYLQTTFDCQNWCFNYKKYYNSPICLAENNGYNIG